MRRLPRRRIFLLGLTLLFWLSLLEAAAQPWWDSNYSNRKQITITAGSVTIPSGYSVPTTFDHAGLVTAGKSQADGDDARVLYWNGSSWVELDRALDENSNWNSASTKIWFKTQASISASGTDNNYYLYYGNATAGNPPANKSNIYLFFDNFEAGNLNNWTIVDGLWQVATDNPRTGTYSLKYPAETSADRHIVANPALNEAGVYLDAWWRFSDVASMDIAQIFRRPAGTHSSYDTNLEGTAGWDIAKEINGSWSELAANTGTPTANTWVRIAIAIYGTGMRVFKDGTQINPASGSFNVGTELTSGNIGFRKWNVDPGFAWWIDDVVARKYVDPEPSSSLGAEEHAAFRAAASAGAPSGTLTLTIAKPTGTVSGDVMIAAIGVRPNTAVITPPSGWTLIRRTDQASGAANSQAIYRKVAGESEPASYSWTFNTSTGSAGGIMTFWGVSTTSPINVENGQATSSALTHSTPSVTTTIDNTLLVTAHSFSSAATWTAPTGMTEAVDVASRAVPNAAGLSLEMSYVGQPVAGATGTKTATASNDADAGVAHILALTLTSPLPIQLASFAAYVVRDQEVEVAWITVSETNNYGFEVHRKRGELGEWTKLGFVPGHGTTLEPYSYSYIDRSVPFGKYYYRLKQIDLNGKSETFPEMEVTVGMGLDKVVLAQNYPNPFNPTTTIEFIVPQSSHASLKVYNILGQEVASLFEGNAVAGQIYSARFIGSKLPSGLYFYVLSSAGKTLTRPMVLLK